MAEERKKARELSDWVRRLLYDAGPLIHKQICASDEDASLPREGELLECKAQREQITSKV